MKRLIAFICVIAVCFSMLGCQSGAEQNDQSQTQNQDQNQNQNQSNDADSSTNTSSSASDSDDTKEPADKSTPNYAEGVHHCVMKIKHYGTVNIEIYSYAAPLSAQKFCTLAAGDYYDGKPIYSIMDGLYMRMGNSSTKNLAKYLVKAEYKEGGGTGTMSLKRGTIALSRNTDGKKSNASSFIVFLSDASYLDDKYASFAKVTEGIDIFEEIADKTGTGKNSEIRIKKNGTVIDSKDCPVITSITMVD